MPPPPKKEKKKEEGGEKEEEKCRKCHAFAEDSFFFFSYAVKWKLASQVTPVASPVGMATPSGDAARTSGNAHIKSEGKYFSIFIGEEQ